MRGYHCVLTPEDIEGVDLPRAATGGYKTHAVTALLRQVAWDFRRLLHERAAMQEDVTRVRGALARSERREELESALLGSAQSAAREIRETARREAELILKKAREHATELQMTAEREYAARTNELRQIEELSRLVRTELRVQLKSVLEALGEPAGRGDDEQQRPVMADLQRAVQAARAAAVQRIPGLSSELRLRGDVEPEPLGGEPERLGYEPERLGGEPPLPADDPTFEEGERVA